MRLTGPMLAAMILGGVASVFLLVSLAMFHGEVPYAPYERAKVVTAATLTAQPIGTEVMLEGKLIGAGHAPTAQGLVAWITYGNPVFGTKTRVQWTEFEFFADGLVIDAGGPVKVVNGDFRLDACHTHEEIDPLDRNAPSGRRYVGFSLGDGVLVTGRLADGGIEVRSLLCGTRQAWLDRIWGESYEGNRHDFARVFLALGSLLAVAALATVGFGRASSPPKRSRR